MAPVEDPEVEALGEVKHQRHESRDTRGRVKCRKGVSPSSLVMSLGRGSAPPQRIFRLFEWKMACFGEFSVLFLQNAQSQAPSPVGRGLWLLPRNFFDLSGKWCIIGSIFADSSNLKLYWFLCFTAPSPDSFPSREGSVSPPRNFFDFSVKMVQHFYILTW